MSTAPAVLLAVATELAKLAKERMPKLRDGEMVVREWYENRTYFRESMFDGKIFCCQYDFERRETVSKCECDV